MKKKAFSIAEAFIALLIVSVTLGVSAPIITKQMKKNDYNDVKIAKIQKELDAIKRQLDNNNNNLTTDDENITSEESDKNSTSIIPSGAIMFFNKTTCPSGWSEAKDKNGNSIEKHYPRIASEGDLEIGTTKEQMIQRHKHVSPFITHYSVITMNALRYGPYNIPGSYYKKGFDSVKGDLEYPDAPDVRSNGNGHKIASNLEDGSFGMYGYSYPGSWHYDNFLYTSDGLNRKEYLFGIKNAYNMKIKEILTCPNRDEGNKICKPEGNQNGIPYLKEMAIVGEENRPNSITWLACEKD